jgi:hypothetical protein
MEEDRGVVDMVKRTACNIALLSVFSFTGVLLPVAAAAALGDAAIERPALGSTITVKTSARFAGAVSSIVFRGKEFVDSRDHGRELQSADFFDVWGECFNPTEAGNVADGAKQTTSSKLLGEKTGPGWLATQTDMAFWTPPDWDYKTYKGRHCGTTTTTHAVNKAVTAGYLLDKRIEIGKGDLANVISDHVTFTVPEAHSTGTFEAATLYTPSDFSQRYVLNLENGNVEPTTLQREQGSPVILATPDGKYAVGLFSPLFPPGTLIGYGTFGFPDTSKINCVFREKNVAAGQKFSYECDFALGTLDEVKAAILKLHANAQTKH